LLHLPPNTGWIFNTIVPANITGEAAHHRATCGNASNPCHHQGRVGDRRREVNEWSWTVHRRIAGKGRTLRTIEAGSVGSWRWTETDVVVLGHAISHAGIWRPHLDRLILAPTLIDRWRCRLCPVQAKSRRPLVAGVIPLGQINLVAWFPKADCCAARRRFAIPAPEAREYPQLLAIHFA